MLSVTHWKKGWHRFLVEFTFNVLKVTCKDRIFLILSMKIKLCTSTSSYKIDNNLFTKTKVTVGIDLLYVSLTSLFLIFKSFWLIRKHFFKIFNVSMTIVGFSHHLFISKGRTASDAMYMNGPEPITIEYTNRLHLV